VTTGVGPKGSKPMLHNMSFHGCLGPNCRQTDVMKACGVTQLLDAALAGYNVTIFAYGQVRPILPAGMRLNTAMLPFSSRFSTRKRCRRAVAHHGTVSDLMLTQFWHVRHSVEPSWRNSDVQEVVRELRVNMPE
jgi:hypothetical protein